MSDVILDNSVHLVGTVVKRAAGWGCPWDTTEFEVGLYLELCVKNNRGKDSVFAVYMLRDEFNCDPLSLTLGKEIVVDGFLHGDNGWHAVMAQSIKPKTNLDIATNHFELDGTIQDDFRKRVSRTHRNIINVDDRLIRIYRGVMIVGQKLEGSLREIGGEKIHIEGAINSAMVWSKSKCDGKPYENLVSDFKLITDVLKRV